MRTFTNRSAASREARRFILAAAALAASAGAAAALDHHPVKRPANAKQYYGLYPTQSLPGVLVHSPAAADDADQLLYHRSGSIGREGLGESPRHPEGPGNVSD
jgi:hypothetical protein